METFVPMLRAQQPAGWFVRESVQLFAPDGGANVIISSEPVDPSLSMTDYASMHGHDLCTELPGFRQHTFEPAVVFGQFPGYVREFAWTPTGGVEVIQVQCCVVQEGRVYTGTATTPTTAFPLHELMLRYLLVNVTVGG